MSLCFFSVNNNAGHFVKWFVGQLTFYLLIFVICLHVKLCNMVAPQTGESQTRVALFWFSPQPSVIIISIMICDLLAMLNQLTVCVLNLMTWLLPNRESLALFWFSRQWQLGDTVGPPSSLAALCGGRHSITLTMYPVVLNEDQLWSAWNIQSWGLTFL